MIYILTYLLYYAQHQRVDYRQVFQTKELLMWDGNFLEKEKCIVFTT